MKRKKKPNNSGVVAGATRRRVTQDAIDEMAALRRQGITFQSIGARLGCSERTARRYAGRVEPRLQLPQERPESESTPRAVREDLLCAFLELLQKDSRLRSVTMRWQTVAEGAFVAVYGEPPSVLFLSEAEHQIRERLDALGDLSVGLLAREKSAQHRFLREVIGDLYQDYVNWHRLAQGFGNSGEDWRPPQERAPAEAIDDDLDL